MSFPKLIKDGKVAVLVSSGYGAGWSTWGPHETSKAAMCMHRDLAQAVIDGDPKEVERVAERLFPEAYKGGLDDLEVRWLNKGTRFSIEEYDGNEFILDIDSLHLTA